MPLSLVVVVALFALGMYWSVATLEFVSGAGTPWKFPETFGSYAAMDVYLESPLYVPLTPGKREPFRARVRGAEQVHLRIGEDRWLPMTPAPGDLEVYSLAAEVPADGVVRIMAKASGKDARHWPLVDYSPEKNTP